MRHSGLIRVIRGIRGWTMRADHTTEMSPAIAMDSPALETGKKRYIYLVKVKTSVTLPRELLESIDRHERNRSSFIERATRAYLGRLEKARRDSADLQIIDRNAGRLNREAKDVLEYQRRR